MIREALRVIREAGWRALLGDLIGALSILTILWVGLVAAHAFN